MKNTLKKTLSLLLALTMVLSLGLPAYAVGATADDGIVIAEEPEASSSLPIGAGKKIGFTEEEEIVSEDLIVDIVSEESVVEEEAAPAKDFSYSESATGFSVEVSAPAGALPLGTEMVVDRLVDLSSVQNAVDRAENLNGSVQLAADISFWLNGEEIEPAEGTKLFVRMSAPEIEGIADPIVIHVPDGENAVPEIVEQMSADDDLVLADAVSFEASEFSVYAIIKGSTDDNARLKIVFMNGETQMAEMYLKKADVPDHVNEIIYDPGVPVDADKLFMGWTQENPITFESETLSMDEVRELAVSMLNEGVEEGSEEAVLTLYAKMFKVFYLYYTYQNGDDYVTTKTEVAQVIGDSASFTVNENYVPSEPNKGMIGWVLQGSADDESAHVYKNGDPITVTKDTVLEPKVVEGCWIHFFENDGKEGGASYTPPVFVPGGENASSYRPSKNPTRPGYTFDDWYTTATGTEKFNFNQVFVNPPENGYDVYAHWTPNPEASYKIVIWAQSVNDDKDASTKTYDYVKTVDVSGVPSGTKITDDVVAPYTNYGNAFFNVTDLDHGSKAFKFSNWAVKNGVGTDKDEVSPANDTVVNVYYDRMLFTVKFTGVSGGSSETYYLPVESGENVYGLIDGEYVHLTVTSNKWIEWTRYAGTLAVPDSITQVIYSSSSKSSAHIYSDQLANVSGLYSLNGKKLLEEPIGTTGFKAKLSSGTSTSYYLYSTTSRQNGSYCQLRWTIEGEYSYSYNGEPYTGQLYEKTTGNVRLYTGLYGQSFSQYGYEWFTPDSTHHWKHVSYLDAFTGNLFGHSNVGGIPNVIQLEKSDDTSNIITIVFWTQDVDNPNLYVQSGSAFYSCVSTDGFNITDRIQGMDSAGYRWSTSASQPGTWNSANVMSSTTDGINSNGYTNVKRGSNTYLHIKYDRKLFDIVFMNGSETVKTVKDIPFGSSISSYQSEAPTIIPGDDSHYFAGWYEDPLGTTPAKWDTTMPLGNKVVYAVTAPVEYHVMVFLNGGALPEGTAQKLSFWVPYETVLDDTNFNNVTYTADDHHTLLGYYTDEACTIPWDFSTKLTGDSLTYTYSGIDDPKRSTEHPDYPGENDVGYETTVGYFMLYAGWRDDSILANGGLKVHYVDSENGYEYTDPMHYADKASVVATAAVPETYWPEGMKFEKWQLLDKGDANTVVNSYYPTEEFIADSKYADDDLVITLVPLYVEIDPEVPTHIYWYANNGTGAVQKDDNVQINKGVNIPTQASWTPTGSGTTAAGEETRSAGLSYDNHVFLGWARVETGSGIDTSTLDEDDLWLVWKGDHFETDVDGVATKVTQVACDEEQPYHDLYAVWAKAFYVYHSGSGEIERILMSKPFETFDLTALVDTSKYLYGGYYTDYAGKSTGFDVNAITNWTEADAASASASGSAVVALPVSKSIDSGVGAMKYNGSNVTWANANAYTVNGNAVSPSADAPASGSLVYYIKEVPIGSYLQPKLRYTYTGSGKIGTSWLFTNTDDTNYSDVGFMITATDAAKPEKVVGDKATSVTITPSTLPEKAVTFYVGTAPEGTGTKTELFANSALMSYKKVYNNPSVYSESDSRYVDEDPINILTDGASVYMFWVTPDNMIVTSQAVRTYNGIATTGMQTVKDTQNSTISVYPAS